MTQSVSPVEDGLVYERGGQFEKAEASYGVAARAPDPVLSIKGRLGLARLRNHRAAYAEAVEIATAVASDARKLDLRDLTAQALIVTLAAHELRGQFADAERVAHEALAIATSPRTLGAIMQNLGTIAAQQKDFEKARYWFGESADHFRSAGYSYGLAIAVNNEAAAARDQGQVEESERLSAEALELARAERAPSLMFVAIENRAHALLLLGRTTEALELLAEGLGFFTASNEALRYAECLELFGAAYVSTDPELACRFWRFAVGVAEKIDATHLLERLQQRIASAQ